VRKDDVSILKTSDLPWQPQSVAFHIIFSTDLIL
jgi:hypothetical protein